MTDFDSERLSSVFDARQRARNIGYVQHVQLMLLAAGLASLGIVGVAAAVMGSLF